MNTFESMWERLSNKKFREQYALSFLKRSVAFQIKTLRKKHCGSQMILADRSELTQGVVSRAEDQEYGNLTFNTVGRIAGGLDMAFVGRFVPFSELLKYSRDLSEAELEAIPTFTEETHLKELDSVPQDMSGGGQEGKIRLIKASLEDQQRRIPQRNRFADFEAVG